jgi:hypothetical protein
MAKVVSRSKKRPSGRSKPARKKGAAKATPNANKRRARKRVVNPLPGDPFEL